jgi:hypothetical protein
MPRLAISSHQKALLRNHAHTNPHLNHKSLQEWFQQQFSRPIAQSSVSEILSSKYAYLDSSIESLNTQSKRRRQEHWPELEQALSRWVQRVGNKTVVSDSLIRERAQFFFSRIPKYEGMELPKFSNGWLQNFKGRRSFNEGEAGGPPRHDEIEEILRVTNSQARDALKLVQLYEEQAEDGDYNWIQTLNQYETTITRRLQSVRQQGRSDLG